MANEIHTLNVGNTSYTIQPRLLGPMSTFSTGMPCPSVSGVIRYDTAITDAFGADKSTEVNNAVLSISRHDTDRYTTQLGFSGYGIFARWFSDKTPDDTTPWRRFIMDDGVDTLNINTPTVNITNNDVNIQTNNNSIIAAKNTLQLYGENNTMLGSFSDLTYINGRMVIIGEYSYGDSTDDYTRGVIIGNLPSDADSDNADWRNYYALRDATIAANNVDIGGSSSTTNIGYNSLQVNIGHGCSNVCIGEHAKAISIGNNMLGNSLNEPAVINIGNNSADNASQLPLTKICFNNDILPRVISNATPYINIGAGTNVGSRFNTGFFKNLNYSQSATQNSDERLKNFGDNLKIDFDALAQIRKANYTWKDTESYGEGNNIGVSAQEVQKLYPEVVVEDPETTILSVDYAKLSVVALAAIDELHKENVELKSRFDKLEELITKLTK